MRASVRSLQWEWLLLGGVTTLVVVAVTVVLAVSPPRNPLLEVGIVAGLIVLIALGWLVPYTLRAFSVESAAEAGTPQISGAVYRKPEDELSAISLQISRLEQLRGWMAHDAEFGRLVDSLIGKQVLAAEERQKRRAILTAVISSVLSLIAGWLLSALSPTSALVQLFHR